jgi:hypothetical protein
MAHSARECSSGAQALNMLREKASLNEGHGFSRAVNGLPARRLQPLRYVFSRSIGKGQLLPRLTSRQTIGKTTAGPEQAAENSKAEIPNPLAFQTDSALETRRVPQPAPACRGVSLLRPGILLGKANRVRPEGRTSSKGHFPAACFSPPVVRRSVHI